MATGKYHGSFNWLWSRLGSAIRNGITEKWPRSHTPLTRARRAGLITLLAVAGGLLAVTVSATSSASAQSPAATDARLSAAAAGSTFNVVAKHSGLCLTAAGPGNGSAILQLPCNPANDMQKWKVDCFGCVGTIRNVGAGDRCLDLWGGNNTNATSIILWDCYGASWQDWRMNWRGDNYYEIRGRVTDNCVDVADTNRTGGGVVYEWGCNWLDNANQQWRLNNV